MQGREAERKSVKLEIAVTKNSDIKVEWTAIDDFRAGYDIRSSRMRSTTGNSKWSSYFIEVKSSVGGGSIFLTRQEWDVAQLLNKNWELHLWIEDAKLPYVIDLKQIENRIPRDGKDSEWKNCEITITDDLLIKKYAQKAI